MSLANPRHELFARALARGQPASEAYVVAGYCRNQRWASELFNRAEVKQRVAELQDQAARRVELTVDQITERLLALAAKAAAREDAASLSVARACLVDASRLNGLAAEKGRRGQILEDYLDKLDLGPLGALLAGKPPSA
jgi:phage terminase small subunit